MASMTFQYGEICDMVLGKPRPYYLSEHHEKIVNSRLDQKIVAARITNVTTGRD